MLELKDYLITEAEKLFLTAIELSVLKKLIMNCKTEKEIEYFEKYIKENKNVFIKRS